MLKQGMAALAAWLVVGVVVAQPVYKWVDAQGRTHYGTEPPEGQAEAQPLKLQGASGTSPTTPPPRKELPPEARKLAESFTKGIMKVEPSDQLSCPKAVDNAQSGIDTMLEVGEKNMRGGYIDPAQFQPVAAKLRAIRSRISMAECTASTGEVRAFYQCMSSPYNHVAACGQKHKYE